MAEAPLSRLTHDVVQDTYRALHALLDSLSETAPPDRPKRLLDFFMNMRHRFARLLVIVRWFMSYSAFHGSANATRDLAFNHANTYTMDADTLYYALTTLRRFNTPPCALADASHILASSNYLFRLPRIIESSIGINVATSPHMKSVPLLAAPETETAPGEQRPSKLERPTLKRNAADMVDTDENDDDVVVYEDDDDDDDDVDDDDDDDVTEEALERLKLHTRRVVNDHLPRGVCIIREGVAPKGVAVRIGVPKAWSADVILDSLPPQTASCIRLLSFRILVDGSPDAPTLMHSRQRAKERALPLAKYHVSPLREMLDDRMRWACIVNPADPNPPSFAKRMRAALHSLSSALSLEFCGAMTMAHVREQVGALMMSRTWRDSELTASGRWMDDVHFRRTTQQHLHQQQQKRTNKERELGTFRRQPVCIWYWQKSYRRASITLDICQPPRDEPTTQQREHKNETHVVDLSTASTGIDELIPMRLLAVGYDDEQFNHPFRRIIEITHQPPLPELRNEDYVNTGDIRPETQPLSNRQQQEHRQRFRSRTVNTPQNPVQFDVSSINVQKVILDSARIRAHDELGRLAQALFTKNPACGHHSSADRTKSDKKPEIVNTPGLPVSLSSPSVPRFTASIANWGSSCTGLAFGFPGGGGDSAVGLMLGISLMSGGVFIRPRGSVEVAMSRNNYIGSNLRHFMWSGERFFRSEDELVNTMMHIVSEAASVSRHFANARTVIAAGFGACMTWPVSQSAQGDKSSTSVTQQVQSIPSGNVKKLPNKNSSALHPALVPPFVPIERKRPRSFMTLDSVAAPSCDSGEVVSEPGTGAKTAAKRARTSHVFTSLGMTMRRIGDHVFLQGQNKQAALPPLTYKVSAEDIAMWSELRQDVRNRMLREQLLAQLMDAGVISSWRGQEYEDDMNTTESDEEEDEVDKDEANNEKSGKIDNEVKEINSKSEAVDEKMEPELVEAESSNFSTSNNNNIGTNTNTNTNTNINTNHITNNPTNKNDSHKNKLQPLRAKRRRRRPLSPPRPTNEALVEVRTQPIEVARAFVRILDDESWELEVRLARDIFPPSHTSSSMGNIEQQQQQAAVSRGQGEANYIRGEHHILRFHYASISGSSVRGCIREVMRARAAATLGLGLVSRSSNDDQFTIIQRTHQFVVVHSACGAMLHVGLGSTSIEVNMWPHPYVVEASGKPPQHPPPCISASALSMLRAEVVPLMEEVLSESRKQMGSCLAAILNMTIPMAVAMERAVARERHRSRTRIKFVSILRARIVFVVQISSASASRKVTSGGGGSGASGSFGGQQAQQSNASPASMSKSISKNKQVNTAASGAGANSSSNSNSSTTPNKGAANPAAAAAAARAAATTSAGPATNAISRRGSASGETSQYMFALDVDGQKLNGQIILSDVGRLRRYRLEQSKQQGGSANGGNSEKNVAGAGKNGNDGYSVGGGYENSISGIPTWKAVVEQLIGRELASSLNNGNSILMKIDILYKVVHALIKSVAGLTN